MLRIKEIPPRPAELDGCVHVGGLAAGWEEAALQSRFVRFGPVEVERVLTREARPDAAEDVEAVLRFGSRAEAEAAVAEAKAALEGLGDGAFACYEYNERPYDDEGEGRGWCRFESGVSTEVTNRAAFMAELAPVMAGLPPKVRARPPRCALGPRRVCSRPRQPRRRVERGCGCGWRGRRAAVRACGSCTT